MQFFCRSCEKRRIIKFRDATLSVNASGCSLRINQTFDDKQGSVNETINMTITQEKEHYFNEDYQWHSIHLSDILKADGS